MHPQPKHNNVALKVALIGIILSIALYAVNDPTLVKIGLPTLDIVDRSDSIVYGCEPGQVLSVESDVWKCAYDDIGIDDSDTYYYELGKKGDSYSVSFWMDSSYSDESKIDDFRLYSNGVSNSEVSALYNYTSSVDWDTESVSDTVEITEYKTTYEFGIGSWTEVAYEFDGTHYTNSDLSWNADGTKLYVSDKDGIYEYNCYNEYDVFTCNGNQSFDDFLKTLKLEKK